MIEDSSGSDPDSKNNKDNLKTKVYFQGLLNYPHLY